MLLIPARFLTTPATVRRDAKLSSVTAAVAAALVLTTPTAASRGAEDAVKPCRDRLTEGG